MGSLRLALWLLGGLVLACALGTALPQDSWPPFRQLLGPAAPAARLLGLNRVFTTWWFHGLLALLAANLLACTGLRTRAYLRRDPVAAARRLEVGEPVLLAASHSPDQFTAALRQAGWRIYPAGEQALAAQRGRLGRLGLLVVHASLLVILAGASLPYLPRLRLGGAIVPTPLVRQEVMLEQGQEMTLPLGRGRARLERLRVPVGADRLPAQYYSELSIEQAGRLAARLTVSVNHPATFQGLTFYQQSWLLAAVPVRAVSRGRFETALFRPELRSMQLLPQSGLVLVLHDYLPDARQTPQGPAYAGPVPVRPTAWLLVHRAGRWQDLGWVRQGEPVACGDWTLILQPPVLASGLLVRTHPGLGLVWAGFALLAAGLGLWLYVREELLWIKRAPAAWQCWGQPPQAAGRWAREVERG